MIPIVRPVTLDEVIWISSRLRPEDAAEVLAASGEKPEDILPITTMECREAYTMRWEVGGDPVVIFGVGDDYLLKDWGVVWLLATVDINKGIKAFAREVPHWLNGWMTRRYPAGLHNLVDTRNKSHLRWLRRMNFQLGETIEQNGVDFQHFTYRRTDVRSSNNC